MTKWDRLATRVETRARKRWLASEMWRERAVSGRRKMRHYKAMATKWRVLLSAAKDTIAELQRRLRSAEAALVRRDEVAS